MEKLKSELAQACQALDKALSHYENEQNEWKFHEEKWTNQEKLWQEKEEKWLQFQENYQSMLSKNERLKEDLDKMKLEAKLWREKEEKWSELEANYMNLVGENEELSRRLTQVQTQSSDLSKKHEGCDDKIAALRSVARALESENQLLSSEKENLDRFKKTFCKDNPALKVAVDQIDALRRQLLNKDQELRHLHKQFDYQEVEKIKIVQKFAQVEQDLDAKSHELRKVKSNLSDKEDTLEALRGAKRDVEMRLQTQMSQNSELRGNLSRARQTQEQLEALQSELVMQESIYDQKMKDMQIELNHHIDEINQSKEVEMNDLKGRYSDLFHEKAEELQTLRSDLEASERKIQQQSRAISDLEFKEKELNALLSKKMKCHHLEFDRTYKEMENEIDFLRQLSLKSESELKCMEEKFAQFKLQVWHSVKNCNKIKSVEEIEETNSNEDSGLHNSSSSTSHEASIESISQSSSGSNSNASKRRRGKKKRK